MRATVTAGHGGRISSVCSDWTNGRPAPDLGDRRLGRGRRRGDRIRAEADLHHRRGVVPADATTSRSRRSQLQQKAFPQAATPAAIIVFERARRRPAHRRRLGEGRRDRPAALSAKHIPNVTAVAAAPASPNKLIQIIAVQMPQQTNPQRHAADRRGQGAARPRCRPSCAAPISRPASPAPPRRRSTRRSSGNRADAIIAIATIGLILVLLLIIFRSPIIALLPIIIIGVVSQIATGLIGWANKAFDLKTDSSVSALLIVVLFGVGTDYILFLMFRYRERLRAGEDPKTAMISAVTRVGEAIASAAGAVIIAFLALTLSTLGLFKSLGPALAIAVAVTLLAGLTLIPAIVSLLGTKVFWPSKAWKHEPTGARFAAIGASLGRRPALVRRRLRRRPGRAGDRSRSASTRTSTSAAARRRSTSESTVWQTELLKGLPAGATEPSDVYLRVDRRRAADRRASSTRTATSWPASPGVGQVAPADAVGRQDGRRLPGDARRQPAVRRGAEHGRGPAARRPRTTPPRPARPRFVGGITSVFVDIQAAVEPRLRGRLPGRRAPHHGDPRVCCCAAWSRRGT